MHVIPAELISCLYLAGPSASCERGRGKTSLIAWGLGYVHVSVKRLQPLKCVFCTKLYIKNTRIKDWILFVMHAADGWLLTDSSYHSNQSLWRNYGFLSVARNYGWLSTNPCFAGCIFENFVFSDDTDIIGKVGHSPSEHDFVTPSEHEHFHYLLAIRQLFRRYEC